MMKIEQIYCLKDIQLDMIKGCNEINLNFAECDVNYKNLKTSLQDFMESTKPDPLNP